MGLKDIIVNFFNSTSPNLDSLEGIYSIPNKQNILSSAKQGNINNTILYQLQKKATEHKKNGRMDLAIACLEKAFYMMLESDYFYGDYAYRYIRYLKDDRQFDKARHVERILDEEEKRQSNGIPEYIVSAKQLKTDLVEASYYSPCDGETAKYRGRIFSISGKDKRFPKLTLEAQCCDLEFYPFVYGISEPNYCQKGQEISYSTRPFVDDRDEKEKLSYEKSTQKIAYARDNEDEYYWIYEHLPELAPKSLSGYTRMKNAQSKNFLKIVESAKKLGYNIQN